MFWIPPRPYLLGDANVTLSSARQYYIKSIPTGATWTLKFLLVNYLRTVGAGIQSSQDLSYSLYDANGRAFQVQPVMLPMFTSPAGALGLNATGLINIAYPGGSAVKLLIQAEGETGTVPADISITLYGIRGWEKFGGS